MGICGEAVSVHATLVSIVCPSYDSGARIDAALASARRQTHDRLEILVGDDGSGDDTLERARAHARADARVRVFDYPHCGDPGRIRARLCAQASGEAVAYLDHDDRYRADHIASMLPHVDPRTVVVAGADYVDADGRRLHTRSGEPWSEDIATVDPFCEPSRVMHAAALLRTESWRRSAGGLEDWDLWWRWSRRGMVFRTLDTVTAIVTISASSRRNRLRDRVVLPLGTVDRWERAAEMIETCRRVAPRAFRADLESHWGSRSADRAGAAVPEWLTVRAFPGGAEGWILGFAAAVVDRGHARELRDVLERRFPRLVQSARSHTASSRQLRPTPLLYPQHPVGKVRTS